MRLELHIVFVMLLSLLSLCHIPDYIVTPSSIIEQHCIRAESCIHDTIKVCGEMSGTKRTFLDHCDLLEFVCDSNQVYVHIEDTKDCPKF